MTRLTPKDFELVNNLCDSEKISSTRYRNSFNLFHTEWLEMDKCYSQHKACHYTFGGRQQTILCK